MTTTFELSINRICEEPKDRFERSHGTSVRRRHAIAWKLLLTLQIAALSACKQPRDVLVLEGHRFPERWHIQFFDTKKNDLGSLDVHFTEAEGRSCLGSTGKTFLVVVDRRSRLSSAIKVTDSPALSFDGSDFVIDLTGGMCDAYVLMKGTIPSSGAAAGEVSTLGWSPPRTIATFVATAD